jgi:hypothetical protein
MIEIIFPTIPRWHCIDLILENLRLAEKPEDIQILCIASGDKKYTEYIETKLKKIFKKVRIVLTNNSFIEHDQLRGINNDMASGKIYSDKLQNVYKTYQIAVDNIDKSADYFWFIEDDTLFPLNTYSRYMGELERLKGDIITGISYYWDTTNKITTNFWKVDFVKTFGENDTSNEKTILLTLINEKKGVVKIGASGLGNVIAKKDIVLSWQPRKYLSLHSGADISFFINAIHKGFKAYGMCELYLPHITKYSNNDIEIRGRIDKSLIKLLNKQKT